MWDPDVELLVRVPHTQGWPSVVKPTREMKKFKRHAQACLPPAAHADGLSEHRHAYIHVHILYFLLHSHVI